jgi:hypothetical protein
MQQPFCIHYIETLKARLAAGSARMIIFPEEAKKLVNPYYKNALYE